MNAFPTRSTQLRAARAIACTTLALTALHAGAALSGDSAAAPAAAEATPRAAGYPLPRVTVADRTPEAIERTVAALSALRASLGADVQVPIYIDADDDRTAAAVVDRVWAAGLGGTYLVRAHPAQQGEWAAALKQEYLHCEAEAATQVLDFGSAARCSEIYETLLRGVFRGRYEDLHRWWANAVPAP